MDKRIAKRGEICLMGEKNNQEEFSAIVKKAYDQGLSDRSMTVQQLIEDIKHDLLKLKV
jgi:hypothetical protein